MTKVITINSCRECPFIEDFTDFAGGEFCVKYKIHFPLTDDFKSTVPSTIHPDCKLNDLPTVEDAVCSATIRSEHIHDLKSVEFGATFVINKINGE